MRADPIVDAGFLAELAAAGLYEAQTLWGLAGAAPADRTAVVCPVNGEVTYGTLVEEAAALAAQWQHEGLRSGDVAILQLPNCYEFVLAHLALTRLGAITLAVPTNYRGTELAVIANASHARAVVCSPSHRACPDAEVYEQLRQAAASLEYLWPVEEGVLRAAGQHRSALGAPPDP